MRNLEGGFLRVVMWYPWQREDYVMAFRWHRFPWPMCNNGNRLCLLVWCVCHGNGNRWKWAVNSVWIKWASWAPVRAERRILSEWSFPSFHPSFLPSFFQPELILQSASRGSSDHIRLGQTCHSTQVGTMVTHFVSQVGPCNILCYMFL